MQRSGFVQSESQEQGTYNSFDQSWLTDANQIVNTKIWMPVNKGLWWFHKREKKPYLQRHLRKLLSAGMYSSAYFNYLT